MSCHAGWAYNSSTEAVHCLEPASGKLTLSQPSVDHAPVCYVAGEPSQDDLARIRTRKPGPPVLEVTLKSGEKARVWCTFGAQQIDINPFSKFGELRTTFHSWELSACDFD